ncbi:hypothetical protein CA85_27560 [Allorhodopirellula solitaria]|uniref:Uncharacterized protein n=1 Tax=Allorhodopirellula solitaria TaxID=2527987 RepID=A0A5C5XW11_9BACT|nr:hypothetical protein CA85_27560 [Allorhodopirellula solitaria]
MVDYLRTILSWEISMSRIASVSIFMNLENTNIAFRHKYRSKMK